jgi:uncharacterized membrane protein YbhN (UPF0104 family)
MKTKRAISLIVVLVVLTVGVWYIVSHRDRFAVILDVPASGVAAIALLLVLNRTLAAVVLRITFRGLGAEMGVLESNLLSWTTRYWNHLPMNPGTGALAVYMKHRRGVYYSQFVAYVLAVNLIAALSRGALGLVVTVPMWLRGNLTVIIPAVFAAMVAAAVGVMALPVRWAYTGRRRILRAISRAGHAWHEMRQKRRLLTQIAMWKTLQVGVILATSYLCFRLVDVDMAFSGILVITLLSPLAILLGFAPAGIGVREVLFGVVTMAFGRSFADGVVAGTLSRAVALPLILVIGPLASYRVFMRFTPSGREAEEAAQALAEEAADEPAV